MPCVFCLASYLRKKKESTSGLSYQVELVLQRRLHCESLRQDAFQYEDSIRRHGGTGSNSGGCQSHRGCYACGARRACYHHPLSLQLVCLPQSVGEWEVQQYHCIVLTLRVAATLTLRQASMSLLGRCRIARTRWVCPFVPICLTRTIDTTPR